MIQDIEPKELFNGYRKDARPVSGSRIVFYLDGKILLRREGNRIGFPLYDDIREKDENFIFLFGISGTDYFFCDCGREVRMEGYEYTGPGIFRMTEPKEEAFALMTAGHICSWYDRERYCGKCGAAMEHDADERMMRCPVCGNHVYPVIAPAVIAGVTDGDRLLLTRYASREGAPAALVAGFNEVGETIEQTVEREVMEETGLRVKDIRYYKSQPWGISGSLLFGFWCRVDGSDIVKLNDGELREAVWKDRKEILDSYPRGNVSLTSEMALLFAGGFDPYGGEE